MNLEKVYPKNRTKLRFVLFFGDLPLLRSLRAGTTRFSASHPLEASECIIIAAMIIHVTEVAVVVSYSLNLAFEDGTLKRVNLRSELYGPVFEPLCDPAYIARARLDPDVRTVSWPNGADFAPDFLHRLTSELSPPAEYDLAQASP